MVSSVLTSQKCTFERQDTHRSRAEHSNAKCNVQWGRADFLQIQTHLSIHFFKLSTNIDIQTSQHHEKFSPSTSSHFFVKGVPPKSPSEYVAPHARAHMHGHGNCHDPCHIKPYHVRFVLPFVRQTSGSLFGPRIGFVHHTSKIDCPCPTSRVAVLGPSRSSQPQSCYRS